MNKFFKDGMTVLFQGDSVTDCHRDRDISDSMGEGYPAIFKNIYNKLFPDNKVKFVNRGVSGDRVRNLLERYDADFKAINPDFVSIMIGINDTWRAFDDKDFCSPERFEQEYDLLLSKIKADFPNAKILIIEQFAVTSFPDRQWFADLDPKREITRKLAEKYGDFFIPMYDLINSEASKQFPLPEIVPDGVHPSQTGHTYMAEQILKALEIV